jgi:hypothetical protein
MTQRQEGSTRLFRGELARMGLHKHHPFYMAWCNMKTRCDNPNSSQYIWYGARGITYCAEWAIFRNFHQDMWEDWGEGLELDRRNNNKPYSYENCRWVIHQVNCLNRRAKGENRAS